MSTGSVHKGQDKSFRADGAIGKFRFVKRSTAANDVAVANAVTDKIIGISQNSAADNEPVTVRMWGNSLLYAGTGGFARNQYITAEAAGTGEGIDTTTAANVVGAIAEDTASADEYGEVQIVSPGLRYDSF